MIRATTHNKRIVGQRQRHNDRQFDTGKASNIDPRQTQKNVYMTCYKEPMIFDDAEHRFYSETVGKALQEQNERYIKSGHRERCKTIDAYRTAKQTCPEETLYYLGKKTDGDKASTALLMKIYNLFHDWHKKTFPLIARLNVALHRDEPNSADHIHERNVYLAHDKEGNLIVSQTKCFQEMGIARPDPSKPQSRYNNPKQTYSSLCRNKFVEIALAHGLEIETTPQEASKTGLSLLRYQTMKEQEKLNKLKYEAEKTAEQLKEAIEEMDRVSPRTQRFNKLFYEALNEPIIDYHPNQNRDERTK